MPPPVLQTTDPKLAKARLKERQRKERYRARRKGLVKTSIMRMDSQWWREYILEHRGCKPLEVLAEVILRPLAEFRDELGCTMLEAYDRRMQAVIHLLPYMHSRMPLSVQLDQAPGVHLVLAGPEVVASMAAVIDSDRATDITVIEGEADEVEPSKAEGLSATKEAK